MKNFFVLIFLFLLMGCVTQREIQRDQDLTNLQDNVDKIVKIQADKEVALDDLRTDLHLLKGKAEQNAHQILISLDQIKNIDSQTQKILNDLKRIEVQIQELEGKLKGLEIRVQSKEEKKNVAQNYSLGYQAFMKGNYDKAMELFDSFLKNYPRDKYADDALYWLGRCYFVKQDYKRVILELENIKKNFPETNRYPEILYYQALSFKNLGSAKEATLFFKELMSKYPKSSYATKAKQYLK